MRGARAASVTRTTARVEVCSSNTTAIGLCTKAGFTTADPGYALMWAAIPS